MNKELIPIAVLCYNTIVVICTLLGVYFISGWMFFLLMALMKLSSEGKDE